MGEERAWRSSRAGVGRAGIGVMRLLVHVEGETDEAFVNNVLGPHLYGHGYTSVAARIIGEARARARRGRIIPWLAARRNIVRHLRRDPTCAHTTLVDYYAMPERGDRAWPGRAQARIAPVAAKGEIVERAIVADLQRMIGANADMRRFVPYVMVHEFEALLFCDCAALAEAVGVPALAADFLAVRNAFETPEHIDDSPNTAPSKRIKQLCPTYRKRIDGPNAAQRIGIERMRDECEHFAGWLSRLEALPQGVQ